MSAFISRFFHNRRNLGMLVFCCILETKECGLVSPIFTSYLFIFSCRPAFQQCGYLHLNPTVGKYFLMVAPFGVVNYRRFHCSTLSFLRILFQFLSSSSNSLGGTAVLFFFIISNLYLCFSYSFYQCDILTKKSNFATPL